MGSSIHKSVGVGHELLEQMIQSCSDGILAFDTSRRYVIWNPAMERISGVAADDCLGRVATDVFPFLEQTGLDQYHRQTLEGKNPVVQDHAYRVPDTGKQGAIDCHYSPIRDASGAVMGGWGVIRDVTERKAKQDEAERSRRELRYLTTRLSEMLTAERSRLARHVRHDLGRPLEALRQELSVLGDELTGQERASERVRVMSAMVDKALAQMDRMTPELRTVRGDDTKDSPQKPG